IRDCNESWTQSGAVRAERLREFARGDDDIEITLRDVISQLTVNLSAPGSQLEHAAEHGHAAGTARHRCEQVDCGSRTRRIRVVAVRDHDHVTNAMELRPHLRRLERRNACNRILW